MIESLDDSEKLFGIQISKNYDVMDSDLFIEKGVAHEHRDTPPLSANLTQRCLVSYEKKSVWVGANFPSRRFPSASIGFPFLITF